MIASPFNPPRRSGPWERLTPLLFLVICVVFSVVPIVKSVRHPYPPEGIKDYDVWYRAGRHVIEGGALYPTAPGVTFDFMYPPFPAVALFAPLSLLGYLPLVIGLVILNSLAWLTCIYLCVYLTTGKIFRQHPLLYIVPAAGTAPYVWDTYFMGQINIILLALLLLAFVALRHKRPWTAGALVAGAAALKAFPILALGYLIYRRAWAAAAATVLFLAVFLVVVPAPVRGWGRNWSEMRTWVHGMVSTNQSGRQIAQRPDTAFTYRNQSLLALTHRLFRPVIAGNRPKEFRVNIADVGPTGAQLIFLATVGALGLCFVLSMPQYTRRTPATDTLELAMLLCLIVLFSPLAWTYYYCWLMLPLAAAVQFILASPKDSPRQRRALLCLIGCSIILAAAVLQNVDQTTQALGATAWGGVLLFLTLGWMLRRSAATNPGGTGLWPEKKRGHSYL